MSINDEIIDENNISDEISSHQNSAKLIDHTCDENWYIYILYLTYAVVDATVLWCCVNFCQ